MEAKETGIQGLIEIIPRKFTDSRGWFIETYKQSRYEEHIAKDNLFIQDNLSCSSKNVLRGLHFQKPPYAQSKLVTVIRGKALDVAVDLRKSSSTFGKHFSIILDDKLKNQLYIPRGFAHGFLSLEDDTYLLYKCDNEYDKESESTLLWDDEHLGIDWGIDKPIVSDKDIDGQLWSEFETPFD
ncbi:MAG: dTDP-4-dehydrorhamnose 3,5-epimerase [Flavobacteriales bacterium]|nr:dTDP-4-dehydrorhamnose 3,5-epimerase [Flavobacteriales bacterium]